MAYENYTIDQFMKAWFKDDRSVMTEDIFKEVYAEYIDTAGLYEQEEFAQVGYIHYLNGRVNAIKLAIRLQKDFINNFDVPLESNFDFFKSKGHILYWKNDKASFLDALEKIENKEKRYISELEICIKKLKDYRLSKNKGEVPVSKNRESFVKTLNSLGKEGYRIDKFSTTVEELAYMISQQIEINESSKIQIQR